MSMGSTHVFGIYAISSMHCSAAFLPVQSMCVFSLVFTSSTAQAAFKGSSVPNQELLLLLFFMGSYLPCATVAHINKLMTMLHLEITHRKLTTLYRMMRTMTNE